MNYNVWAAQNGYVSPPRRPGMFERIAAVVFFGLGGLSFLMYLFPVSGRVPENALTLVEGVPSNVKVWSRPKRYGSIECLEFSVAGRKASISEYHPKYKEVRSAVKNGGPLKAWFATSKNGGTDTGELYKLMAGNQTLMAYADTAHEKSESHNSLFVGGIALTIMGAFVACMVAYRSSQYAAFVTALRQADGVS